MTVSYENSFENCAIYLPALSFGYARFAHNGAFRRPLPFAAQDLNFLNPQSKLFHYPWALFSAGQAAKSINENDPPTMVSERNRDRSIVVGDSGGYQVQTGKIVYRGPETVRRMMRWMEANTDFSMVLDFPTGGIKSGQIATHTARLRKEGHGPLIDQGAASNRQAEDFNAALVQTSLNNQQFVVERAPDATKFLNVLQGRTEAESKAWYEHVKHYAFEGWSFAAGHREDFSLLLQRLIDLRDDGLLENARWVHILGKSELDLACLYTVVQRAVRRHIHPTLQFSFDSASHSLMSGNYQVYGGAFLDKKGWSMVGMSVGDTSLVGSQQGLGDYLSSGVLTLPRTREAEFGYRPRFHPADTAVSRKITVGDICVDAAKQNPWDTASFYIVANHNIEAIVRAMKLAHSTFFDPKDVLKVPSRARIIRDIVDMVFTSDQPDKLIRECRAVLMH
ncbi:hypothetical protein [Sphingomonas sp.]|uniref:hypothetical protein n=1 Tax=Sphingomonas sp. TaxID=28214 RepID=UPI0025D4DB0B|nr:hypothetical protein [Sphingomonas sp.]